MNTLITRSVSAAALVACLSLTGCLTDSKGGVSVALTTKTLTGGAQSNTTYGSSIDIDDFTAHTITEAKTMTAKIDLIFAYSTALAGGTSAIYSPDSAKGGVNGSAGYDFMQDFNNPNHTAMKTINVNFDNITTKAQLDSIWDLGSPVLNGRQIVVAGTTFMARSNADLVVLIKVTSLVSGANGSVNLVGAAKF